MSVGNGPIVSIDIHVIDDTVDRTNQGAFTTSCYGIIFGKWGNLICSLFLNPWNFPQDDITLISSEFSEPPNGHSDVHDMP